MLMVAALLVKDTSQPPEPQRCSGRPRPANASSKLSTPPPTPGVNDRNDNRPGEVADPRAPLVVTEKDAFLALERAQIGG